MDGRLRVRRHAEPFSFFLVLLPALKLWGLLLVDLFVWLRETLLEMEINYFRFYGMVWYGMVWYGIDWLIDIYVTSSLRRATMVGIAIWNTLFADAQIQLWLKIQWTGWDGIHMHTQWVLLMIKRKCGQEQIINLSDVDCNAGSVRSFYAILRFHPWFDP